MIEMHLIQPGFIHCAWKPITKNKERIQKFKETGDSRYSYQKELDKAWIWLEEQLQIKPYVIKHLI